MVLDIILGCVTGILVGILIQQKLCDKMNEKGSINWNSLTRRQQDKVIDNFKEIRKRRRSK